MASKSFDITEDVVNYLSLPVSQQSVYANTGMWYDCAINGDPFLYATSDEHPYVRQFAQMKKDQLDTQPNPGEQSLTMWWTRNQSDFSGGAGINYYEPVSDERVMRSYKESVGINPWTVGQLSLLNKMDQVAVVSSAIDFATVNTGSSERIVVVSGTTIQVRNVTTGALINSITTGFTGPLLGVISIGNRFIVWSAANIYISNTALTTVTGSYSAPANHTFRKVWYAKQRLFVSCLDTAGDDTSILTVASVNVGSSKVLPNTAADIIALNTNSDWLWTSVIDSPKAVLASGYIGNKSSVYQMLLTEATSTGGLTLSSATILAEMPTGEVINNMILYVGSYVGLATNRGARVGLLDDAGNLTYGQLLIKNTNGMVGLAAYESYLWVGGSNAVAGNHGTYRINLGDQDTNAYVRLILTKYAYATDVYVEETTNDFIDVAISSAGNKIILTSNGYIYIESTTKLASGYITTGQTRYSTYENKLFKKVAVKGEFPTTTTVNVISVDKSESEYNIFTVDTTDYSLDIAPRTPQYSLGFKLTLNRSTADTTVSPTVRGIQVKALPAVNRQEILQIPLLCFDFESDMHGNKKGGNGTAKDRYLAVFRDTKLGDIILIQDFHTGENFQAIVEELQFQQVAPPRPNTSGFGGILTIQARTVY